MLLAVIIVIIIMNIIIIVAITYNRRARVFGKLVPGSLCRVESVVRLAVHARPCKARKFESRPSGAATRAARGSAPPPPARRPLVAPGAPMAANGRPPTGRRGCVWAGRLGLAAPVWALRRGPEWCRGRAHTPSWLGARQAPPALPARASLARRGPPPGPRQASRQWRPPGPDGAARDTTTGRPPTWPHRPNWSALPPRRLAASPARPWSGRTYTARRRPPAGSGRPPAPLI